MVGGRERVTTDEELVLRGSKIRCLHGYASHKLYDCQCNNKYLHLTDVDTCSQPPPANMTCNGQLQPLVPGTLLFPVLWSGTVYQLNCVCRHCPRPPLHDAWNRISSSALNDVPAARLISLKAALLINVIISIIIISTSSKRFWHMFQQSWTQKLMLKKITLIWQYLLTLGRSLPVWCALSKGLQTINSQLTSGENQILPTNTFNIQFINILTIINGVHNKTKPERF